MSSLIGLAISGVAAVVNWILPPSRELLEERYLNEATDLYDLEYRIREIDRGSWMLPRMPITPVY
jgi:hypothetical protein